MDATDAFKTLEQLDAEIQQVSDDIILDASRRRDFVPPVLNESNVRRLVELFDLRSAKREAMMADMYARYRRELGSVLLQSDRVLRHQFETDNSLEVILAGFPRARLTIDILEE